MESHEFFLVTLPGLEDIALAECQFWYPEVETSQIHGGITIKAPLSVGLSMNQVLKVPTRILLRLDHFKCRDFPKLFKKISGFPWSKWVSGNPKLNVTASASRSRLKMKKRIEETCQKGWLAYHKNQKVEVSAELSLYVRFLDDLCTLSLDTSGERLHKRGHRTDIGEAPLRETIAAGLIQWMVQELGSGLEKVEIIDPMMGSGTFLIESAVRDQVLEPRNVPIQSPNHFTFIQKKAIPIFTRLMGFERDKKTFEAAQRNLSETKSAEVLLFNADLFEVKDVPSTVEKRWVICNPPYGVRLKVEGPLNLYYAQLFLEIEKKLKPDGICFLIPVQGVSGRLSLPVNWKVKSKRRLTNGGIPVTAYVFERFV